MEVKSQTISAGEKWTVGGGVYFELFQADAPVDIVFFEGSSPKTSAQQVKGGFWNEDYFESVEITSATSQTIQIGVSKKGRGGYRRSQGSVDVTSGYIVSTEYGAASLTALLDVSISTVSQAKLADADSSTIEIHIETDQILRLGDVTNKPDATHGVKIPVGTHVIKSGAEIWAFNVSGSTANVTVSRLT